jgi:hypothetical protein
VFEGRYCRVEALDAVRHGEDLWREFAGNDTLWTYFPSGPFATERSFAEWLDVRASLPDPSLDSEWPARKQAFERWLAPENFDAEDRQLLSLSALNEAERG